MIDLMMRASRIAGIALLAALMLATPALADDDDDEAATPSTGSEQEFGAFIRDGSCDQPGDVLEDIGDLGAEEDDVWAVFAKDGPKPGTVYGEREGIQESIGDLTGGDYVVTIHGTDDATADMVACGEIAGEVDENGALRFELDQVDGSGLFGAVRLAPSDDGDERTEVTVGVWQNPDATPASTPGA